MQKFSDFKGAITPIVNKITCLATDEEMSAIKFFSKNIVPMLFDGAKTGKFKKAGIDFTRNILANFRQNVRISKISDELEFELGDLNAKCIEYYNSLGDITTNEEKALYGLRQALLLCNTNRLTHARTLALIDELNFTTPSSVSDEVLEVGDHVVVFNNKKELLNQSAFVAE